MAERDRARWNQRYREGDHVARAPAEALARWGDMLPRSGHALDVAGGAGHNARWLAARGLCVTLVDISDVALALATARAEDEGLSLRALAVDLEQEQEPLPRSAAADGRYQVIACLNYLQRDLIPAMIDALAPGGWLLLAQPTVTNLERNSRPSRRFLLERGEQRRLVAGLIVERHDESWTERGTHVARLLARKPA